jgi:hypothetical protein
MALQTMQKKNLDNPDNADVHGNIKKETVSLDTVNVTRVGYVEGARELRDFVSEMTQWLRERDAVVENVALTRTPTPTVEEVVLHLLGDDGGKDRATGGHRLRPQPRPHAY